MMKSRDLHLRLPLSWILILASIAFLFLGLRTFFLPEVAATFYGAPASAPEALVFVRAYGARNIAISLMALILLWQDDRRGLAALLACAALIAALDAVIMNAHAGFAGAAKHLAYVAVLSSLSLAAALWGESRGRTNTMT